MDRRLETLLVKSHYFNTTHSTHPELTQYESKAVSQEARILDYFKTYEAQKTPSNLLSLFGGKTPITSIRRALSNLTAQGELVKTEHQVLGPYRRPEYVWSLADKYRQREMEL